MARKTIIITENQLGEICGSNTAYLDNSSDYAEDGTIRVRTDGAVTDAGGEKTYSEPTTTDDYADELAPETLFALLFRNGGHGLWGHWGTGLRTPELDGFDREFDDDEEDDEYIIDDDDALKKYFSDEDLKYLFESNLEGELTEENAGVKNINLDDIQEPLYDYDLFENGDANYYFSTSEPLANNSATMEEFLEMIEYSDNNIKWEFDGSQAFAMREDGSEIQIDAGGNGDFMNHIVTVTCIKKKLQESNGELEDRTWRLDLDNDGQKKTYSYTNLTTKKTELKQLLSQLVQQNAPKQQIQKVKSALAGVCRVLDRETGAIEGRKRTKKKLGFNNQYQKEGGTKDAGNGKAHSKKIKDPNVGTGFISYYA